MLTEARASGAGAILALAACSVPTAARSPAVPVASITPPCAPRRALTSALGARVARQVATTHPASHGAVVVGVFDGREEHVFGFGRLSPEGDRRSGEGGRDSDAEPDATTVFEVGSLTKPMVGVLLADEVERGRLSLADEAQRWLPELPLPAHPNGAIRLEHLATFTAGLPWMPTNWVSVDRGTYTRAMWRDFLATYPLARPPGDSFAYGNVGFGVLGDVIAAREGSGLGPLLRARLFGPLGMSRSWLLDERPAAAVVAVGHDAQGLPVPLRFDKAIMPACCAVESTAGDLLRFLRAHLAPSTAGPLAPAIELALTPRRRGEGDFADRDVGLGWMTRVDARYAISSGAMKGYRSSMLVDRAERVAAVVLAADASFPAEALVREVAHAAVTERDQPRLPTLDALPEGARPVEVIFDGGLRRVGWSAPARARRGEAVTVRFFYRASRAIEADFTVFVHAESRAPRVLADHAPARPMTDWPVGTIVEDRVTFTVPSTRGAGPLAVFHGFYRASRLPLAEADGGDGHDRAPGPVIAVDED